MPRVLHMSFVSLKAVCECYKVREKSNEICCRRLVHPQMLLPIQASLNQKGQQDLIDEKYIRNPKAHCIDLKISF